MNNLDKRLLQILINKNNYFTIEELATKLGCSRRTIYNSLGRIEDFFKENSISYDFDRKYAKGIKLSVADKNISTNYYEEKIVFDIFSKESNTMKELMEKYYISYNELSKILENINKDINLYELKIEIRQNSGIELIGEKDSINLYKRNLMLKSKKDLTYLSKMSNDRNIDMAYKISNLIISDLKLDKRIENLLFAHINYLISIKEIPSTYYILDKKSTYYDLALSAAQIFEKFVVNKNKDELIKYFNQLFDSIDIKNYLDIHSNSKTKAFELIKSLKEHFEKIGDYVFGNDENHISNLQKHIELTFIKLNNNEYINNPLHETIKNNYPYYYNEVIYVLDKFNRNNKLSIPPQEASYIVIYIITMENNNNKNLKAVIVCNYGVGISQYLQSILMESLNWIDFIEPINVNEFYQNDYSDYLVFSTLDLKANKFIKIPVNIDKIDIKSIYKQVNRKDYLYFFKSELFFINPKLLNKKEIIKYICDTLECNKMVKNEF